MWPKLLLIGASGHCKSIIDSLNRTHYEDLAIIDSSMPVGSSIDGIRIAGTDSDAPRLLEAGWKFAFIAVGSTGDVSAREKLFYQYAALGFQFPNIIDYTAIVSLNVQINDGTFVGKGAIINTGVKIGKHSIVNTGAIIEHDCEIGMFAHIGPGARLSGAVKVGVNTHVGIGTAIIQSVTIGENTTIGAGSVVTKDIPANAIAVGVPCKLIKTKEKC